MRTVLTDWPYRATRRVVTFGSGDRAEIQEQQIALWIALASYGTKSPSFPDHRYFPAVVDTGYGGRLLLNHRHLSDWSGLSVNSLLAQPRKEGLWGEVACPRYRVAAWLLPGDPSADPAVIYGNAFRLTISEGVTVIPRAASGRWSTQPRLPLIGMKLL
jgi:hypothetical protein